MQIGKCHSVSRGEVGLEDGSFALTAPTKQALLISQQCLLFLALGYL